MVASKPHVRSTRGTFTCPPTWTMTSTKCAAAIQRLISIMRSSDKTEFVNRLKTPNLTDPNGHIFCRRDKIQMCKDEVLIEEVVSQQ